jgi:DNA helicase-2/ATP-dependent DNA helicase PcrA
MWKQDRSPEAPGRLDNLKELLRAMADYETLGGFLEHVSLVMENDEAAEGQRVSIMTLHGAKGLEFDVVFVPGLEDGIFPSARSVDERNGVEEERRLMYVAITRAKKELFLSYAKTRYIFGDVQMQAPSRFLKELPESEIEAEEISSSISQSSFSGGYSSKSSASFSNGFSNRSSNFASPKLSSFSAPKTFQKSTPKQEDGLSGKRVFHQKFGYGKVLSSDGPKLEIAFEKSGTKTITR